MEPVVLVEKRDKVWSIRMNHPSSMNSLEKRLRTQLKQNLMDFREDGDSRVAVLTGCGKVFSSGGSLEELGGGMSAVAGVQYMKDVSEIILLITSIEKPIIASVNGAAIGAGFNIALACDIIIASSNAKFSQAFAKVGLIPDLGGLYFLPRVVGMHKAKELIYSARMLSADEALEMGLVNTLVPDVNLEAHTWDYASTLAQGPIRSFELCKSILSRSWELSLSDVLQYEALTQSICMQSNDHKEGIQSFYEKREPDFLGN